MIEETIDTMEYALSLEEAARKLEDCPAKERAVSIVRGSSEVKFSGSGFRIGGRSAAGLLGRIEKTTGCSSGDPRKIPYSERARRKSRASYHPDRLKRTCPKWGKAHGSVVHKEISRICKAVSNFGVKKIRKKKGYDDCTTRFLRFLSINKWIPVMSELPVGDANLGVATACDLLVIDAVSKELILVEIKTGYEDQEYGPVAGDKRLPFGLMDCPRDKHALQVAGTVALMPIPPHRSFVVRMCSKRQGLAWREVNVWRSRVTQIRRMLRR